MQLFSLFVIVYAIKAGGSVEFFDNVTMEKLVSQVYGVINYALNIEDAKPIEEDVTFNLYTRTNPNYPQTIIPSHPKMLLVSNFRPEVKTYFVIHGYTDHKDRGIIANLRTVLVDNEEANVFVVDWRRLARLIYFDAANQTHPVGTYLGEFLNFLEAHNVKLDTVHLIGHSLGAQISGIAGRHVGGRVGRITGLDPAGPLFEFIERKEHEHCLDKTDALFVDIIHTDGEEFGVMEPIGDADFYPNGGMSPQPGCNATFKVVSCSHIRSVEFYTESVNSTAPFDARKCKIWEDPKCINEHFVPMGHHCPTSVRGLFYLETNAEAPFAKERPQGATNPQ